MFPNPSVLCLLCTLLLALSLSNIAKADDRQDRQAAAVKYLSGVNARTARDENGAVVSVDIKCTFGLWDHPEVRHKNWLPKFAEHLRAFPSLKSVTVSAWAYEDEDLRHLAEIPQLVQFDNGAFDVKKPAFTGAGLKHLVMPASLKSLGLFGKHINDDTMRQVGQLSDLRTLRVNSLNVTGDGLRHLESLELEKLYLLSSAIQDDGFRHLAEMRQMRSLTIISHDVKLRHIRSQDLAHLTNMRELTKLELPKQKIGAAGVAHLANLTELTELDLSENEIGDAGLEHLAELRELRRLDLSKNRIRGRGLRHLSNLTKLEELRLGGNAELDDATLMPLLSLSALEYLIVTDTKVSIAALREFRKHHPDGKAGFSPTHRAYGLDDKWRLELRDDWRIRIAVLSDEGEDGDLAQFGKIAGLADAEIISLGPQITIKGLAHLRTHTKAKRLSLRKCKIGDEGLKLIGHLTQLESLALVKGNITGDGLAHLSGLTEMRHLTLVDNGLNDEDLVHLQGMTKLEHLDLGKNDITIAEVARYLHGAKNLRWLDIRKDGTDSRPSEEVYQGDKVQRLLEHYKPK